MGGGKGGAGRSGKKRSYREVDADESDESDDNEEEQEGQVRRRDNKQRRVETLGKKAVQKEVYKRSQESQKTGAQWSR